MIPQETRAIFTQALQLPTTAKAGLIALLLDSVTEGQVAGETDAAWSREARDRFQAFLQGQIAAEPVEEAMQALRRRLCH